MQYNALFLWRINNQQSIRSSFEVLALIAVTEGA